MALDGGVALDVFEANETPTRGLGAIWVGSAAGREPLPLVSVAISATAADRIAEVTVTQVFRNTFTDPIEAVYTLPLDGASIVSSFEMQVGERTLRGVVKERAAARQEYQRALDEGRRAALLEQERDDVFTIQLGNLPPGEDATIRLTYSEELTFFDSGLTELRLPLVLGVRYIAGDPLPGASAGHGTEPDTDIVPDASRLTPPRLAEGFDPRVDLSITVRIGGGALADLTCSQHATRLGIDDDHTTITLARSDERLNRDFVLRWRVAAAGEIAPTLFFHRRPSGERYGILSAGVSAGGSGQVRARDVIFVLDRSGSMEGPKMSSAARACSLLLNTLGPADRFGLLTFNEGAEWLIGSGGAEALVAADRTGIARGEHLLRAVQASGGTELYPALRGAFDCLSSSGDASSRLPVIVLITDGQVGDESRALQLVQRAPGRVFTVGVDTTVNSGLLKRLAHAGRGTFVLTEPGGALDDALAAIAREIGAPLVEGLTIALRVGCLTDVAPERLPDLFAGRATTIAFRADAGSIVRLNGRRSDGSPFSLEVHGSEVDLPAIAHLWARRRLSDLEDRYRLATGDKKAIEAEIVAISTSHAVLSRFTAFVVVDDRQAVVSPADRRTIVQPVEMPHLWAGSRPAMSAVSTEDTAEFLLESGRILARAAYPPAPKASRWSLFSRGAEPLVPAVPDVSLVPEIAEHIERLLDVLRAASATHEARQRQTEALAIVDRLLTILAVTRGPKELRRLVEMLERLRRSLKTASEAGNDVELVARDLSDAWSKLAPRFAGRGRFWDAI